MVGAAGRSRARRRARPSLWWRSPARGPLPRGAEPGRRRAGRSRRCLAASSPAFAPLFRRWLDDQERLWQDTGLAVDRTDWTFCSPSSPAPSVPLRHADLADLCRRCAAPASRCRATRWSRWRASSIGDGESRAMSSVIPSSATLCGATILATRRSWKPHAQPSWAGPSAGHPLNAGKLSPHDCPRYLLLYCAAIWRPPTHRCRTFWP